MCVAALVGYQLVWRQALWQIESLELPDPWNEFGPTMEFQLFISCFFLGVLRLLVTCDRGSIPPNADLVQKNYLRTFGTCNRMASVLFDTAVTDDFREGVSKLFQTLSSSPKRSGT